MRDRFTRSAIKDEFQADPEKDSVTLDAATHLHATPVADNRYTVIWQDLEGNVARVRAVVASQLRGESAPDLKAKLEKVAAVESNGMITSF
jgi:hypothetical protein